MSVHCLFCSARSWKECHDCPYSKQIDEDTLLLVPSGIFLRKDGKML